MTKRSLPRSCPNPNPSPNPNPNPNWKELPDVSSLQPIVTVEEFQTRAAVLEQKEMVLGVGNATVMPVSTCT